MFAWLPDLPEQAWSGQEVCLTSGIAWYQAGKGCLICLSRIFDPPQKIRHTNLICEKSIVRITVLKINFYLINFSRARFLFKWHLNLPKYYKINCRNYGKLKIRHCLISGCLISGGYLIHQVRARSKSGSSQIEQAAAWSTSGSSVINHDPCSWEV